MENEPLVIRPKRIKGEDGYKVFSVRIREEIVSQIEDISAQTGRSRNELIGLLLEYAIGNCVIDDSEKITENP